jgi:hypothetical protein
MSGSQHGLRSDDRPGASIVAARATANKMKHEEHVIHSANNRVTLPDITDRNTGNDIALICS